MSLHGKRKEIYKYEAPWTVYAMNWSVRPDKRFRLALGSFVEEYNNKVGSPQVSGRDGGKEALVEQRGSAGSPARSLAVMLALCSAPSIRNPPPSPASLIVAGAEAAPHL